jgi:hypothetical protein
VFHWPLSDLVQMELAELIDWRQRAVALWNRMNGVSPWLATSCP